MHFVCGRKVDANLSCLNTSVSFSVSDMAKQHQPTLKPEEVAKRLSKALDRDTAAFTSALLALIKKRGMTTMAKEIGVSRHTLYRYEWGDDRPLLETAVKMARACGFKLLVVPVEEVKTPSDAQ